MFDLVFLLESSPGHVSTGPWVLGGRGQGGQKIKLSCDSSRARALELRSGQTEVGVSLPVGHPPLCVPVPTPGFLA